MRQEPHNRHWTAEDDAKLIELRASGKTNLAIANTLGRSKASVTVRYSNLKKAGRVPGQTAAPAPQIDLHGVPEDVIAAAATLLAWLKTINK